MRLTPALLTLGFWATCSACSSSGSADSAPPSTPPASPSAPSAPPFVSVAAWKPTSVRLEVHSFGFFDGSMGYVKDRVDMTPAQLRALDGLRTRPPFSTAPADVETFHLAIVDVDGGTAEYVASDRDLGVAGAATTPALEFATLQPFLATLTCMKAVATRNCLAVPDAAAPPNCKAKVSDDAGCLHGVFVGYDCSDIWMTLDVSRAGDYELATVDCIETTTMKLLSADGVTVIATSAAGAKPSCPVLAHTFDAAGTFRLLLQKRNTKGCSGTGAAGDSFVRVTGH